MIRYEWYQWLAFFYVYCFIGWCIESTYVSTKKRRWVNRGFLRLPMLPLYGSGAVLMLFVSVPFRDHLLLVFVSGMIAATLLEYLTGVVMEKLFKVRYWDYSKNKFQFQGHICLGTSICWGLLTVALTKFIHNPIQYLVVNMNEILLYIILLLITLIFIGDTVKSVRAALDLGKVLVTMTKLREEWEELQSQMEQVKTYAKKQFGELQENTEQRLEEWKENATEQLEAVKERYEKQKNSVTDRLNALKEEIEQAADRLDHTKSNLLRRNPTAASRLFGGALKELKERNEKKHKKDKDS